MVRHLDSDLVYPDADELLSGSAWPEELSGSELADVLRSAMGEKYAHATGEEIEEAPENVLGAMSPAETPRSRDEH